jgi:hypothetical protein
MAESCTPQFVHGDNFLHCAKADRDGGWFYCAKKIIRQNRFVKQGVLGGWKKFF